MREIPYNISTEIIQKKHRTKREGAAHFLVDEHIHNHLIKKRTIHKRYNYFFFGYIQSLDSIASAALSAASFASSTDDFKESISDAIEP